MTLQEAYSKAIEKPIKHLPAITIRLGSIKPRELFLDLVNDEIQLVNEPGSGDDTFFITATELISNQWELIVDSDL